MEKFSANFTDETRAAGERLVQQGLCAVISGSGDGIRCEVRDGAELYDTAWTIVEHKMTPSCECTQFTSRHELCPHLWAALVCAAVGGEMVNALKRNVSSRVVLKLGGPSGGETEMSYCPEDGRKKARPSPAVARRPAVSRPAPHTTICRSELQAEILFILPVEKQRADTVVLELAWRPLAVSGGGVPQPAKRLQIIPEEDAVSPVIASVLGMSGVKLVSGCQIELPLRHFRAFTELLDEQHFLRWSREEERPRRMHAVSVTALPGLAWRLSFERVSESSDVLVSGELPVPQGTRQLGDAMYFWESGIVLYPDALIFGDARGHGAFLGTLAGGQRRRMLRREAEMMVRGLLSGKAGWESGEFPEWLRPEELNALAPTGRLYIRTARYTYRGHEQLHAEVSFNYGGTMVEAANEAEVIPAAFGNRMIQRQTVAENALLLQLQNLGFRLADNSKEEEPGWKLSPDKLDNAVRTLVMEDWFVSAEGKNYRKPTQKTACIASRLDWFELNGSVSFDGITVPLPALLETRRNGRNVVRLDDGTYGVLPLDWLEQFTALTEIGESTSESIRFRQQQAGIVSDLLEQSQIAFDESFARHAEEMSDIRMTPALPPADFQADLRPYQQDGLGWLLAMNRRGLGACLADDMGLGKTCQILALLDTRKEQGIGKPTLVVMPKSLIFNWQEEARRFAPRLRVAAYTGAGRRSVLRMLTKLDVMLTTYGTLRNDVEELSAIHFDYCILDESQAIKNADSSTARACCAIQADYRIAMTGTPIENRLAELFSQLNFLNPGLLGRLFKEDALNSARLPRETFDKVRRAVRCFVLRRTKESVAKNLPPKTEQVLWVQLEPEQQAEYNALRDHYRDKFLEGGDKQAGASVDTLAALMKLRQAACHPALVFQNHSPEDSAKLSVLREKIHELTEDNHKVLVFSQYTRFLKYVADALLQDDVPFVYLDGQTTDRKEVVQRFQTDESVKVFLISLMAGGVGLNLTAADYIFILDPWWNPATQAQAIDRAYRIGQDKPVFAYKMIAKDTIEEKVLLMQQRKQKLADAFLRGVPMSRVLSEEDVRFLLG